MTPLQKEYNETIRQKVQEKLGAKNIMQVPHLTKIVVNMGVKDAIADKKNIERAIVAMTTITGQKPKVTKAKKSIASFKVREGDPIGLVVTMRGDRMYAFMDKIVRIVLPRLRDFHGIPATSFDTRGNYTLGLTEYAVFPEIDPGSVERMQGLEISFVVNADGPKAGFALLEAMGMPFEKEKKGK